MSRGGFIRRQILQFATNLAMSFLILGQKYSLSNRSFVLFLPGRADNKEECTSSMIQALNSGGLSGTKSLSFFNSNPLSFTDHYFSPILPRSFSHSVCFLFASVILSIRLKPCGLCVETFSPHTFMNLMFMGSSDSLPWT